MAKILQIACKRFMILLPINRASMQSKTQQSSLQFVILIQSLIAISFAVFMLPFSSHALAHLTGGFVVVLANSTLLLSRFLKPSISSLLMSSLIKYAAFSSLLLLCHAYTSMSLPNLFPGMMMTQLSFPLCCYMAERFSWQ